MAPARASWVAVDVVARLSAAETRAVGLPPATGEAAGRALVDAVVDGAAQRRPPGGAGRATAADRGVRRPWPEHVVEPGDRQRGADDRNALQERAARGASLEPAGGLVDERRGEHLHPLSR